MPDSTPRRLPRGRHALAPDEVQRIQRSRLCLAMAQVVSEKGFVNTSVEDVLKRAVVSRQSFYQVFDSKLDCFMAAFDRAGELLMERLAAAVGTGQDGLAGQAEPMDPMERFEVVFTAYLDALATELPFARLFLVEVFAAGSPAVRRRGELQNAIVNALADLMGVTDPAGRYTCKVLVMAVSTMVTLPLADADAERLRAVGPPMIEHVRRLWQAGVFGAGSLT